MNDEDTLRKVSSLIGDLLDLDELTLTRATTARDVEGWDSLAHVRIVVAAELAFGVRFATGEITSMKNVGDLVDLIERRSRK
jgi:acyl carrier protein